MDKLGIDSFEDLFLLMAQAHLPMPQSAQDITLLPDTGPVITLAYANAIARNTFFMPPVCQKVSTRAFLIFLQQKGWIESASAIERAAVQAGRQFLQLRFPPISQSNRLLAQ